MRGIPLQLRLAGIFGALGGAIGSLLGAFFRAELINLAVGSLLGCTAGFVMGYRIGGLIKQVESLAQAERFASGADRAAIVIGWVFVAIGAAALIKDGWDLSMLLVTVFFLMCSLYLTYRRLRARK